MGLHGDEANIICNVSVWIISLQEAMKSSLCETLYVTEVLAEFEADTFFPPIDTTAYHLIK